MKIAYLIKQKLEAIEKFITKIFDVEKCTNNLINLLIQIEVVSKSQVILRLFGHKICLKYSLKRLDL